MDLGLVGKAVLISGATQGIGRATAEIFASEGARLMLVSRRQVVLDEVVAELRLTHPQCEIAAVAADLSMPEGADQAVAATLAAYGTLHVLINNHAATENYGRSVDEMSDEEFTDGLEAKPIGYVRLCRRAIPVMKAAHEGVIINLGGAAGKHSVGPPDDVPYPLGMFTDAALLGLTKSMADTLGRYGIRVLTINPGGIRTPRMEDFVGQKGSITPIVDSGIERRERAIPLGRMGDPAEIARVIVFMSSRCASFVTGTSVLVDGGGCRAVT